MMNAFSVTKKKKFDNGKINYGTVSKPPQKKKFWAERQGVGREKGRALQSKTLPENFFGSKIISLHVRSPIAPDPNLGRFTQQDRRDIYHQE